MPEAHLMARCHRLSASGVLTMLKYELESTAERRARRNNDIKHLFYQLTIEENMSFMEAYEAVGYVFYLSAAEIRRILASMNKSVQNAHNPSK